MIQRSLLLPLLAILASASVAQGLTTLSAAKTTSSITGLYKAVALDNKTNIPGIDGKFKFSEDGTFQFTRKTFAGTLITHGSYSVEGTEIKLTPAKHNAVWPDFWAKPAVLTVAPTGELAMNGLTFTPSLIGKMFAPGLYRCEKAAAIHYFFDRNGGYKYTGQGMSTGEYWVEEMQEPETNAKKVTLILNILRIDGKRVNFHQHIALDEDGGFTLEKKYKYKKVESVATLKRVSTDTLVKKKQ
jgi:hypothetical protein